MAEIAKISRENQRIRAQLSRAAELGPALGGAPDSEQGQQSTELGERSASVAGSTGRRPHQGQVAEGELLRAQVGRSPLPPTNLDAKI